LRKPLPCNFHDDLGEADAKLLELFSGPDRPEAILSSSDYRAIQTMKLLKKTGLRIPEDVAVIGFWNTPFVEVSDIPLASVYYDTNRIISILSKKITNINFQNETVLIEPELKIRESAD